jgi:hypothetical protein
MSNTVIVKATIDSGQTQSSAIVLENYRPVSVLIPDALTGLTLSFGVNDGTGSYKTAGGISLSVVTGSWLMLTDDQSMAVGSDFTIVSNLAEASGRSFSVKMSAS